MELISLILWLFDVELNWTIEKVHVDDLCVY